MDFFQHQEVARRKTGLLVVYFLLAVVLIIGSVYLVVAGLFLYGESDDDRPGAAQVQAGSSAARLWDPALFGLVAAGVGTLIGGGSLYRIASLSGGGHTVAELLGGRPVDPNTTDPEERRLLNVVEEMAIAAGTPIPPVYLLENEPGINAFAAGHTMGDAVIGVTRGCVRNLSRDELQGVIAHEFSHILNGDMRLNIRLMGILFGILLISLLGWILLRSSTAHAYRMGARDNRKGANPLPLLGLALYIIGYVGVFFGNLIKAAVSRQREYLADASAVQFTRNPDGIAGALKKIGALSEGSRVREPEAVEASHMFFGDALGGVSELFGLLATHPPLTDRIRRIDPTFDGDFSQVRLGPTTEQGRTPTTRQPEDGRKRRVPFNPAEAITRIGTLDPQQIAQAAALLGSLPDRLTAAAREPLGAHAVVYALLLDRDESIRSRQLARLTAQAPEPVARETQGLFPLVQGLAPEARLPLAELALPALRRMSPPQFREFLANVRALTEADAQSSLFEYALSRMLLRHLGTHYGLVKPPAVRHRDPASIAGPTAVVLSALARVGSDDPAEARRAFAAGAEALGWPGARLEPSPGEATDLQVIDNALRELASAAPPLKKAVLQGCAACIENDGHISPEEGELLRAIADALDCPMPPLPAAAG